MNLFLKFNLIIILIQTSRRQGNHTINRIKDIKFTDTQTGQSRSNDYFVKSLNQKWEIGKEKKDSSKKEKIYAFGVFHGYGRGHG